MPILNPSLSTELVATTDLQPPSLLIDSCVGGECVLYAGAGLGARAGFATFRPFWLKWCDGLGLKSTLASKPPNPTKPLSITAT